MKRWLVNLSISVVAILVVFLAVEAVLRIRFLVEGPPYRPSDAGLDLNPGGSGYEKGAYVKISSQGLRDHEYPLQKPPNTYRIIVLGDSTTFGTGVQMEERYPKRLEGLLDAGSSRQRYEVLNFGIPGAETHHEVATFEQKALAYKPDLLILGYFLNDIVPPFEATVLNDGSAAAKTLGSAKTQLKKLFAVRFLLEKVDLAFNLERTVLAREERTTTSYSQHIIGMYSTGDYWEGNRRRLLQLVRLSRENNARILVTVLPFETQVRSTSTSALRPQSILRDFGEAEQIPVVDLIPALSRASGKLYVDGDNIHLNAKGHSVAADAILEALRAQRLLPDISR